MEPMLYAKGISWIDDCRIPFVDEKDKSFGITTQKEQNIFGNGNGFIRGEYQLNNQGRFPANILVSDDMLNDGVITKSLGGNSTNIGGFITAYADESKRGVKSGFGDKGTNSRYYDIDKWFENLLEL